MSTWSREGVGKGPEPRGTPVEVPLTLRQSDETRTPAPLVPHMRHQPI